MTPRTVAAAVTATLLLLPTACGNHGPSGPESDQLSAADTSTCVDDATTVSSFPDAYPQDFPLPTGTVVYHVEDRGQDGVIATGVTATPFDAVLDAMNDAEQAGFTVTTGETEENDAEASWTGNGYLGRWAITRSARCPDQTVIQLLSKRS